MVWRFFGTIDINTYLTAMVTQLPWQPKCNLNNSLVLNCVVFVFDMEVPSDDRHQRHSSLPCKLSCHDNESEILIIVLSEVVLNSYVVWRFLGIIGINHIHRCYGNSFTMAIRVKTSITLLF